MISCIISCQKFAGRNRQDAIFGFKDNNLKNRTHKGTTTLLFLCQTRTGLDTVSWPARALAIAALDD